MGDVWTPNEMFDEEEDEDYTVQSWNGRDGIIYLIDAKLCEKDNYEEFTENCLACIEVGMLSRIVTSQKDLIGVVFYNTQYSPAPKDEVSLEIDLVVPDNTTIFIPLNPITKDTIAYLKNFKESPDLFDFFNRIGHKPNGNNFHEALWLCSRMLMRCGYKLQSSTIILFTNNEEPHSPNTSEFQQTFVRANDLRELNVNFIISPIVETFDYRKFYAEFIGIIEDEEPDTINFRAPTEQRELLLNRGFHLDYRKNCLRYLNLIITNDLEISCGLYSLTKLTKIPTAVQLIRDTNEIVLAKRVCVAYNEDTEDYDKRILPGEQIKVQMVGGHKVCFSAEEYTKLNSIIPPGIRLLGFKPLSTLPKYFLLKSSRILYPYEKNIKGSVTLFRALWEKCLEHKKFALCVFTLRRKIASRYIALVPLENSLDGNHGFRIVFLPMQDDVRSLDVLDQESPKDIPSEGIDLFQKIIRKLKFKYNPLMFENPQLRTFYANLEALVFDEEVAEIEDNTLPNVEHQNDKIVHFVPDIDEIFGQECNISEKRANTGESNGRPAKVPRLTSDNTNSDDIISAIQTGATTKLSVAVLKAHLQGLGEKSLSKLTKAELINRIKVYYKL